MESNWLSELPTTDADGTTSLVYKLKRLKGDLKVCERNKKNIRTSLLFSIDSEILSLLTIYPSRIFSKEKSENRPALKSEIEKMLVHEGLT